MPLAFIRPAFTLNGGDDDIATFFLRLGALSPSEASGFGRQDRLVPVFIFLIFGRRELGLIFVRREKGTLVGNRALCGQSAWFSIYSGARLDLNCIVTNLIIVGMSCFSRCHNDPT